MAMNSIIDLMIVDGRRILRDPKSVLCILAVFVSPLLLAYRDPSFRLLPFTILFFPLVIAWSWGSDLERSALVPLTLARHRGVVLLWTRGALMILIATLGVVPYLVVTQTAPGVLIAFVIHIVLFALLLTTMLASSQAGWIPFTASFLTLLGLLASTGSQPISSLARSGDLNALSIWMRAALLLFFPFVAEHLHLVDSSGLVLLYGCSSVFWLLVATAVAARQPALGSPA